MAFAFIICRFIFRFIDFRENQVRIKNYFYFLTRSLIAKSYHKMYKQYIRSHLADFFLHYPFFRAMKSLVLLILTKNLRGQPHNSPTTPSQTSTLATQLSFSPYLNSKSHQNNSSSDNKNSSLLGVNERISHSPLNSTSKHNLTLVSQVKTLTPKMLVETTSYNHFFPPTDYTIAHYGLWRMCKITGNNFLKVMFVFFVMSLVLSRVCMESKICFI